MFTNVRESLSPALGTSVRTDATDKRTGARSENNVATRTLWPTSYRLYSRPAHLCTWKTRFGQAALIPVPRPSSEGDTRYNCDACGRLPHQLGNNLGYAMRRASNDYFYPVRRVSV